MSVNLTRFHKPSRYIGNEINISRKIADIKVALCFPDTYEIGMSHLGLKILYSIINNIPSASAERVFAPWVDYEAFLREKQHPLSSLEYNRPLKEFNIIGFTLQYELSYTNVLNMLDLGGIPLKSQDRKRNYPLIIAGGPCSVNPLPLAQFIDAFVIGDGEEAIEDIIEVYDNFKLKNTKPDSAQISAATNTGIKENLLKALAGLDGVYVPAVHDTKSVKIRKRVVSNLDKTPFPEAPVVPYTPVVHDRVTVEISRGCTRGCRFCQAGMIYRPLRERSLDTVLSISKNSIPNTGHEDISFASLSTGDYSCLLPLIKSFNKIYSGSNISTSLPSLRVGSVSSEVLKEIKSVRKTGFTIAPEAGTMRLRTVINKDFTDEEYIDTLEKLFTEGWQTIKLYFMIGLPTETKEDIDGIIHMSELAYRKGRKISKRRVNINAGISAFVPKPHTPFQWRGQINARDLRSRQDFLKKTLKRKGINFKGQHVETSLLEAVFSRGDSDCAILLEAAWKEGCRFDSWSEHFDFNKWLSAAKKTGIDLYGYASRNIDINSELPWGFIDTGINEEFLRSEYEKAMAGKMTEDCRHSCHGCGLNCEDNTQTVDRGSQNAECKTLNSEFRTPNSELKIPIPKPKSLASNRIRVKFSKTGILRYLSHREVITAFLRALHRAKVHLEYSRGFHPHPKVSFGPALPVGVEGLNEYFDMDLSSSVNPVEMKHKVNACLPEGLEVLNALRIPGQKKSLDEFITRYEYEIKLDWPADDTVTSFMNLPACMVSRDRKQVDIRPMVERAELTGPDLKLTLVDGADSRVRLYEILKELLQKTDETIQTIQARRVQLYGLIDKMWSEPLESERTWLMK